MPLIMIMTGYTNLSFTTDESVDTLHSDRCIVADMGRGCLLDYDNDTKNLYQILRIQYFVLKSGYTNEIDRYRSRLAEMPLIINDRHVLKSGDNR